MSSFAQRTEPRDQTYRRKFAVDILNQVGAELRQYLQARWLWFMQVGGPAQWRILPESRAGCKTWWSLDICQISREGAMLPERHWCRGSRQKRE